MSTAPKPIALSLRKTHALLTPALLSLLAETAKIFEVNRTTLLEARSTKRAQGKALDFLPETKDIRSRAWRVKDAPAAVQNRRVEITGPVDRKMVINGLNSGANVFMADFEDANAPTWDNVMSGHENIRDARMRSIVHEQDGRRYVLNESTAVLFVRPRGLHLNEGHVLVGETAISAMLFDLTVFAFLNAREAYRAGEHCFLYIPKLESHLEARWVAQLLEHLARELEVPTDTFRVTVLIETLTAAFEMDEILYELRETILGLNCGRWDYIFSFIKNMAEDPSAILPDRSVLTMDKGFLKAYSELLIKTCHRRGAFAMGGMAAQIPIKNDAAMNEAALAKVRADKLREVRAGHDGTWVAHPALVPLAKEIFDREMPGPNQLGVERADVVADARALLQVPEGPKSESGLRHNIRVALQYLEAWLRGVGCVPIYNLMEDAATAEIARAQVWQWIRHRVVLDGHKPGALSQQSFRAVLAEEFVVVKDELEGAGKSTEHLAKAAALFSSLCLAKTMPEFLTIPAYDLLINQ
jgi:malate synthase